MRYTGMALLLFGAGLLAGLGVIAFDLTRLGWIASGMMALGIAALPVTMLVDWRRAARPPAKRRPARRKPRTRRKPPPRQRPVASRRPP